MPYPALRHTKSCLHISDIYMWFHTFKCKHVTIPFMFQQFDWAVALLSVIKVTLWEVRYSWRGVMQILCCDTKAVNFSCASCPTFGALCWHKVGDLMWSPWCTQTINMYKHELAIHIVLIKRNKLNMGRSCWLVHLMYADWMRFLLWGVRCYSVYIFLKIPLE